MAKEVRDKWGMDQDAVISDQLARAGITGYVLLDADGQGHVLPTGLEDVNEVFVGSDGNAHNVWLRWNPNKKAPDGSMGYYELEEYNDNNKSVPWTKGPDIPPMKRGEAEAEGTVYLDPWYIQARKLLDLPVSDDQEEILRDYLEAHPDRYDRVKQLEKTVTVLNQPPKVSE
ncbi:MAG: hypothetical protein M1312_01680 [Patescibacteria group bacterium]|nr:hypothetical protein [Patescibacteria group bacterium]